MLNRRKGGVMPVRIKQKNPGALEKILDRYKGGVEIAVGLPKGAESSGLRYPDGTELLDVAYWNEFGTKRIPERPFIRAGVRANLDELQELAAELIKKLNKGKVDLDKAAEILGLKAAAGVKQYIVDLREPPNAPYTIRKKKGVDNPLVNTSLLNQSITHEVRTKK